MSVLLIVCVVLAVILTVGTFLWLIINGRIRVKTLIRFVVLVCIVTAAGFLTKLFPDQRQEEPSLSATTPVETTQTTTAVTDFPTEPLPEPMDEDFVSVTEYCPLISVELKYATVDNFTGKVIYSFQDAYLRYGTVKKLEAASQILAQQGLFLKIWDGFRPVSAQYALWKAFPDPNYVANPNAGHSSHSRGNTVDVTLVDEQGNPVELPTGFDDFTAKADRNYDDCSEVAAVHAMLLEAAMQESGFEGYRMEWWHYSDTESYPVEEVFDPALISLWCMKKETPVPMLENPEGELLAMVEPGEVVTVMGYTGNYAMVSYRGLQGYLEAGVLEPAG